MIPAMVIALITMIFMLTAAPAEARVVVPDGDAPEGVQHLLHRLSRAFRAGDHEDLVSSLHPEGVQVGMNPQADRSSHITPAQAYYYFKNLFQSRRTARFNVLKHHSSGQDRFLAMAVWHWEIADGGQPGSQRLLFALVQFEGQWRVTEITALRGG